MKEKHQLSYKLSRLRRAAGLKQWQVDNLCGFKPGATTTLENIGAGNCILEQTATRSKLVVQKLCPLAPRFDWTLDIDALYAGQKRTRVLRDRRSPIAQMELPALKPPSTPKFSLVSDERISKRWLVAIAIVAASVLAAGLTAWAVTVLIK